jgi:hypothetical protein
MQENVERLLEVIPGINLNCGVTFLPITDIRTAKAISLENM